jgi:hypothetical protein
MVVLPPDWRLPRKRSWGYLSSPDSTLAMVSRARCTKQCLKFRDPRATNQAASAMADFAPFEIRTSSTFILGGETWRRLNGTRSCLIPYASLKPSSRCLTTHSKSHLQRNFGSRCAMNILTANLLLSTSLSGSRSRSISRASSDYALLNRMRTGGLAPTSARRLACCVKRQSRVVHLPTPKPERRTASGY